MTGLKDYVVNVLVNCNHDPQTPGKWWGDLQTYPRNLKDFPQALILNMHILIKCYLERFASINDPEN